MRPDASKDAEQTRDDLEAQQTGLGQKFLDLLKETLSRISTMPKMYGVVWRNVRAARLRRFRYIVYYRVYADRVEVLAVMHGNRDAADWLARV